MNLFIKKSLFFIIFLISFIVILYNSVNIVLNSTSQNNSVFIWGDSQTYFGIDLDIINNEKQIALTSAQTGSGVYDFLVFSEKIPNNSTVLIGISKPFFLRDKKRDRNDAGLSFNSIKIMKEYGYSIDELMVIIKGNLVPKKLFSTNTKLYNVSDSLIITNKKLDKFRGIFHQNIDFVKNKERLFLKGIDILKKKNCKMFLIEFPLHEYLYNLESDTEYGSIFRNFKIELIHQLNIKNIDTIKLDSSKRLMHDLTHLNELGAKEVSNCILKLLNSNKNAKLIVINGGAAK